MSTDGPADLALKKSAETTRLWQQLDPMIRWIKRAIYVGGGVMLFFVVLEAARMYQTLAAIHPAVGILSLVVLGIALAIVFAPAWRFLKMPRVVEPPPLPSDGKLSHAQMRAELRYLDRYLANCARNPSFGAQRVAITAARKDLADLMTKAKDASPESLARLTDSLGVWSHRSMTPVLREVDDRADRLIYQEALAVGLATAASPNGVLDAFVMLWRSVRLVSSIGVLYYGRPGLWGTMSICRDVSMAVALAGYLQNVTNSLGNVLAGTLGKVGGFVAGPAVDGITNALVLIRIGHLAKERCRSYRRWDAATRKNAVLSSLSATQSVAVGLASEILRTVGSGVGALASSVVTKLGEAGETAMDAAESAVHAAGRMANEVADAANWAAEHALQRAKNFKDAVGGMFREREPGRP